MNLEEVLNYRRSVRVFDKTKPLDPEKVKHCLELATLAPNSSNMQLWEFYQVIQPELLAKISKACLDQTATSTLRRLLFLLRVRIYTGSGQSSCLILKEET
jgi:nitroreductase